MRELAAELLRWHAANTVYALATIVGVNGSAPRPLGATMAVDESGNVRGSLSGGCVEGAVYELCREVLSSGAPARRTFGFSADDAFAVGLTCGGELDVFVHRITPESYPAIEAALDSEHIAAVVRDLDTGAVTTLRSRTGIGARSTVVDAARSAAHRSAGDAFHGGAGGATSDGAQEVVGGGADETSRRGVGDKAGGGAEEVRTGGAGRSAGGGGGALGDHAGEVIRDGAGNVIERGGAGVAGCGVGEAAGGGGADCDGEVVGAVVDAAVLREGWAMLESGVSGVRVVGCADRERRVFVDSFAPPPRMIVFGATDFAVALCRVGKLLGYRVTVCEPRPAFADRARVPAADEVVRDWPHRYLAATPVDGRTVICVLTHDPKFDVPVLSTALRLPVAYVGAMGSRRADRERRAQLRAAGLTDDRLALLHSPIGLELGGQTPEETAVSIAAEIVAVRRGGSARPLSATERPIHPQALRRLAAG